MKTFPVLLLATFAASSWSPQLASAQSAGSGDLELPELLPRDREIALARSAAPPAVSQNATVLVLERGGYVAAVGGSNGVTCYVSRSWAAAIEPHCFDREGSETILAMNLRRAELRERGESRDDIDADIAAGLADGRFRLPRRPALSWMMSADQVLFNDDGQHVGSWKPHFMIYYPYLTEDDLGLGPEPSFQAGVLVDAGKPTSNLMIVVSDFVETARTVSASDGG